MFILSYAFDLNKFNPTVNGQNTYGVRFLESLSYERNRARLDVSSFAGSGLINTVAVLHILIEKRFDTAFDNLI